MAPRLEQIQFTRPALATWAAANSQFTLWPVVYLIDGRATRARSKDIYIGETSTVITRLQQDLRSTEKQHLRTITPITDGTFNRSVCLDLQAYLIRLFAGDGSYRVLNRNIEVIETNYPQRDAFRAVFRGILDQLVRKEMFTRTSSKIEISDLYKLSPFKALTDDQAASVCDIVRQLLRGLASGNATTLVLQGDPGTGKTVVAVFLLKLLSDIKSLTSLNDIEDESIFYDFFTEANRAMLKDVRLGLVIPQQSLRKSVTEVFKRTAGLDKDMVMTAFQLGKSPAQYDFVLVDETHRLNQRAAQPSAKLNADFASINIDLFGNDDMTKTQLDWIRAKSRHQLFLVDTAQGVLPADLPSETLSMLVETARRTRHHFELRTQMRIQAGSDFVAYIRQILDPSLRRQHMLRTFPGYDFRLFDDLNTMRAEIFRRDAESGLARVVAGYPWEWKSKTQKDDYDIEIDSARLRWNSEVTDWVTSEKSLEEVGSVHTIQGYDLNYVGCIIGRDLRYNLARQELWFSRSSYHDTRGKANNNMLKKKYSDADLLRLITQIYAILLTRGIKGTYVYVCDPELRQYLKAYIPVHGGQPS